MDLSNVVRELYTSAMDIPEPYSSLPSDKQSEAQRLLAEFESLLEANPGLPYANLLHPMLLSKNGRFDDALGLTKNQFETNPSWDTAVAYANAARRAGNLELSAEMFAAASEYDPSDLTCWLEVGDIRLEQEKFSQALSAYEKALEKDDQHHWALPSAFYCRHRLGEEGQWLASLQEIANQEGCTCGMEGCLTDMLGGYGSSDGIARAEYLLAKVGS